MAESHVISGLVAKHSELSGEIDYHQKKMALPLIEWVKNKSPHSGCVLDRWNTRKIMVAKRGLGPFWGMVKHL